jgi:hypothetical protein
MKTFSRRQNLALWKAVAAISETVEKVPARNLEREL